MLMHAAQYSATHPHPRPHLHPRLRPHPPHPHLLHHHPYHSSHHHRCPCPRHCRHHHPLLLGIGTNFTAVEKTTGAHDVVYQLGDTVVRSMQACQGQVNTSNHACLPKYRAHWSLTSAKSQPLVHSARSSGHYETQPGGTHSYPLTITKQAHGVHARGLHVGEGGQRCKAMHRHYEL